MIYITTIVLLQVVMLTKLMDGANQSVVAEFVLLEDLPTLGDPATSLCVLIHILCITHCQEILSLFSLWLVTLIYSPMYSALANLSFIDLGVSSVTSRKMIYNLSESIKVISFRGCIAQIFFIHMRWWCGDAAAHSHGLWQMYLQ